MFSSLWDDCILSYLLYTIYDVFLISSRFSLLSSIFSILSDNPSILFKDKSTDTDNEIKRILDQVSESAVTQKTGINFEIGEKVKVCDGPFASFNGLIEEI